MRPLIFPFETENGVELRVWIETYATGPYDEPSLELDGEPLIELIHTPEVPEFLTVRASFTELTSPIPTRWPSVEAVNPAFRASRIEMKDLSDRDQKRLERMIEQSLEDYLSEHFCDISQDLAERAADSLYESWKDGE